MPGGWKGNSVTRDPIMLSPSLMQALLSTQLRLSRSCLAWLVLSILVIPRTEERTSPRARVLTVLMMQQG